MSNYFANLQIFLSENKSFATKQKFVGVPVYSSQRPILFAVNSQMSLQVYFIQCR